jgi:hypothetical protein
MTSENPFLRFWSAGYKRLVPIVPPGAAPSPNSTFARRPKAIGKAPGVKNANGQWHGFDWLNHETTADDLARWHLMGAGVGIRTGGQLVAIDIDTTNPQLVERIVASAESTLGNAPVRVGRAPKLLLLYALGARAAASEDEGVPYRRVLFEDGTYCEKGAEPRVELLAEGRQFVAHGVHPSTGKPYAWPNGLWSVDKLTRVTPAALDSFFDAIASYLPAAASHVDATPTTRALVDQAALQGRLEDVRMAVAALPNTTAAFPTYGDYVRVGYAIKGATQDDPATGLDLFQQWAAKWEGGNDPEVVAADWRRMKPPYALGAQYLYDLAERHAGRGSFDRAATLLTAEPSDIGMPTSAPAKPRYVHMSMAERAAVADTDAVKPLVHGLLDQGAMTVLYGESNSGKTFVALDICHHIASGTPYNGLPVTQGAVAYIVAEGGRGIAKRIKALRLARPEHADAPLYTIVSPVNMLDPNADLVPLTEHLIKHLPQRPVLVVFDTLSRAMAGGDENSSTDMGALVKNGDLLRNATQAHQLWIHHSGKDRARGARGHSLLRAATDTEIEVADNTIVATKQRDIETRFKSGFVLEPVSGSESAIVRLTGEADVSAEDFPEPATRVPTRKEEEVLRAMREVAATNVGGTGAVNVGRLLSYMRDSLEADMDKKSLDNYLRALLAKRLVRKPVRGYYEEVLVSEKVHNEVHDDFMS